MSSDKPKTTKPFEDFSTTEYRPSLAMQGKVDDTVVHAVKKLEDWVYSLRGKMRALEIPVPSDPGISIDQANEVAQTFAKKEGCQPTGFTNPEQAASGLTQGNYTVVQNGYIYVVGQ